MVTPSRGFPKAVSPPMAGLGMPSTDKGFPTHALVMISRQVIGRHARSWMLLVVMPL